MLRPNASNVVPCWQSSQVGHSAKSQRRCFPEARTMPVLEQPRVAGEAKWRGHHAWPAHGEAEQTQNASTRPFSASMLHDLGERNPQVCHHRNIHGPGGRAFHSAKSRRLPELPEEFAFRTPEAAFPEKSDSAGSEAWARNVNRSCTDFQTLSTFTVAGIDGCFHAGSSMRPSLIVR